MASTRLSAPDYLDAIRRESARFREALTDCSPTARVPACPDWDAADLVWHLAKVQWFWSRVIRTRPAGPDRDAAGPERPEAYEDLLAAYDEYSADLLRELAAAGPDEPAYSWADNVPDGQTVGFTYRRQAHEALIHRLDAEQTSGLVTPLDPALAADGVAEALEIMYGGPAPDWGRIEAGEHHVRIDIADTGHEIWVQPCTFFGTDPESGKNYDGPHVLVVDGSGLTADAVVAGGAVDLDTWLWKRRDRDGIEVSGSEAAFEALLEAVSPALD